MRSVQRLLAPPVVGNRASGGLLVARLVFGIALMLHGLQKIQSPNGMTGWMKSEVPGLLQALAVIAEFGGGLALALGLLTPLAAILVAINMATAIAMVHLHDPFVGGPGQKSSESAAGYLAFGLLLLLAGPGRWSLDAALTRGSGVGIARGAEHPAQSK